MTGIFDKILKPENTRIKSISNDKNELHNTILQNFPGYYLTLMSIIQAAAFGVFLLQLEPDLVRNNGIFWNNLPLIFLGLSTFLVLIEIWYEYMMGALAMRWFPKISDSIIPFLLGIFEILMILYLGTNNIPGWYIALSLVCFCSFLAFLNMYRGCYYHTEENKEILESIDEDSKKTLGFISSAAIIFLICGLFEYVNNSITVYITFLTFLLIAAFIIRRHYYWNHILE